MSKVEVQLENVNFWKQFIEQSKKEGIIVHPKMQQKLLQAEESLLQSLLEKHSMGNSCFASSTLH